MRALPFFIAATVLSTGCPVRDSYPGGNDGGNLRTVSRGLVGHGGGDAGGADRMAQPPNTVTITSPTTIVYTNGTVSFSVATGEPTPSTVSLVVRQGLPPAPRHSETQPPPRPSPGTPTASARAPGYSGHRPAPHQRLDRHFECHHRGRSIERATPSRPFPASCRQWPVRATSSWRHPCSRHPGIVFRASSRVDSHAGCDSDSDGKRHDTADHSRSQLRRKDRDNTDHLISRNLHPRPGFQRLVHECHHRPGGERSTPGGDHLVMGSPRLDPVRADFEWHQRGTSSRHRHELPAGGGLQHLRHHCGRRLFAEPARRRQGDGEAWSDLGLVASQASGAELLRPVPRFQEQPDGRLGQLTVERCGAVSCFLPGLGRPGLYQHLPGHRPDRRSGRGAADAISVVLDGLATPFVAYRGDVYTPSTSTNIYVAAWTGTTWDTSYGSIGDPKSSTFDLVLNASNQPIVTVVDNDSASGAYVWNGTSWSFGGGSSSANATATVDSSGNPVMLTSASSSWVPVHLTGGTWLPLVSGPLPVSTNNCELSEPDPRTRTTSRSQPGFPSTFHRRRRPRASWTGTSWDKPTWLLRPAVGHPTAGSRSADRRRAQRDVDRLGRGNQRQRLDE